MSYKSDSYKRLGDYIQEVDIRNRDLQCTNLLGLSIAKTFIPSIANTVGTDFRPYKIVKHNQFAYVPVTSRNGDKITIALYDGKEDCIISQAYISFEIKDTSKLLPEYLMIWFRRPEFDRYARFKSHGSAREVFDWEEMCNVLMPIPDIKEQKRIVDQYNAIQKRIENNQQTILKLEETAQAIYRKMFVEGIDSKNLPRDWRLGAIEDFFDLYLGGTPATSKKEYWDGNIPWINSGKVNELRIIEESKFITEEGLNNSATKLLPVNTTVLAITGVTLGQVSFTEIETCANQSVVGITDNTREYSYYIYHYLCHEISEIIKDANGGAQPHINKDIIGKYPIYLPPKNEITYYNTIIKPFFNHIRNLLLENKMIESLI